MKRRSLVTDTTLVTTDVGGDETVSEPEAYTDRTAWTIGRDEGTTQPDIPTSVSRLGDLPDSQSSETMTRLDRKTHPRGISSRIITSLTIVRRTQNP